MNTKYKFAYMILSLSITLIVAISCHNRKQVTNDNFKIASKNLIQIIEEIQSAGKSGNIERKKDRTIFHINRERQTEIIKKRKIDFLKNFDQLDQFISKEPQSRWTDDAAFCMSLGYIFVISRHRQLFNYKLNYTKLFLSKYQSFEIEDWTKQMLGAYYELFFSQILPEKEKILSEIDIIRGGLYSFLIAEYCIEGKFNEAKSEISQMESEKLDQYFIDNTIKMIEVYQKETSRG